MHAAEHQDADAGEDAVLQCKHCSKPILAGDMWHTTAQMHWQCFEGRHSAQPEPAKTAGASATCLARAAGGHRIHLLDLSTQRALCGFEPSNGRGSGRMMARGRWIARYDSMPVGHTACPHCEAAHEAAQNAD